MIDGDSVRGAWLMGIVLEVPCMPSGMGAAGSRSAELLHWGTGLELLQHH